LSAKTNFQQFLRLNLDQELSLAITSAALLAAPASCVPVQHRQAQAQVLPNMSCFTIIDQTIKGSQTNLHSKNF